MAEPFAQPLTKLGDLGIGVAAAPSGGRGVALDPNGKLPASVLPPLLTTWPAGAPDPGQEIRFLADPANGIVWTFKYDPTQATYPWLFIGGGQLRAAVETDEATASITYVDLATVGPSITIPRSGDYDLWWSVETYNTNAAVLNFATPKRGASATADTDSLVLATPSAGNQSGTGRIQTFAGLSAGDVVKLQYRVSAGTGNFRRRWLRLQPIRVS